MSTTMAVICKAPLPGRVKTRLCPPFTPLQAAELAEAALRDTFDAVRATPCERRIAILDGEPASWLGSGIDVVPQRGGGLDERLANAFEDIGEPAVIIGMDTPQVTPTVLEQALAGVREHGSALGPAADGGYWAIGLARPARHLIEGVPMSVAQTGAAQHARLLGSGLPPLMLPTLVDVDDLATAQEVAGAAPGSAFAAALYAMTGMPVPA